MWTEMVFLQIELSLHLDYQTGVLLWGISRQKPYCNYAHIFAVSSVHNLKHILISRFFFCEKSAGGQCDYAWRKRCPHTGKKRGKQPATEKMHGKFHIWKLHCQCTGFQKCYVRNSGGEKLPLEEPILLFPPFWCLSRLSKGTKEQPRIPLLNLANTDHCLLKQFTCNILLQHACNLSFYQKR